ncbi:hypothetical protein P3342_009109 [Pyrenophora teres f. teres]|nr:hypothetical protein P3342_009109 [Pyrenophora teres f. teres]
MKFSLVAGGLFFASSVYGYVKCTCFSEGRGLPELPTAKRCCKAMNGIQPNEYPTSDSPYCTYPEGDVDNMATQFKSCCKAGGARIGDCWN